MRNETDRWHPEGPEGRKDGRKESEEGRKEGEEGRKEGEKIPSDLFVEGRK